MILGLFRAIINSKDCLLSILLHNHIPISQILMYFAEIKTSKTTVADFQVYLLLLNKYTRRCQSMVEKPTNLLTVPFSYRGHCPRGKMVQSVYLRWLQFQAATGVTCIFVPYPSSEINFPWFYVNNNSSMIFIHLLSMLAYNKIVCSHGNVLFFITTYSGYEV